MTFGTEPLTLESPVCKAFPVLHHKWVVDAVNGIDVAGGRVQVQRDSSGILGRLWDGWTGKSAKRQTEINARVRDSLDGSFRWLRELTESVAKSNLAIARVNEALGRVSDDLVRVANATVEIRAELDGLRKAVSAHEEWLGRLDGAERASLHVEQVFNAWGAGRFSGFSWAGRCYAALEELRWGAFGAYCRRYPEERGGWLQVVRDRAAIQMRADAAQESADSRVPMRAWVDAPPDPLPDGVEALAYVGEDHKDASFVSAVIKGPLGSSWPNAVPLISSASRVATALTDEVLGGAR